ncbi:DUF4350 domain-containing protein [Bacillus sp. SD088]|uniref:DUF4350 domain-containing protein n=1 Tax=Bacillus sp. SD088 TaxID=2782012 RepID=UPI001A9672DA|nr:DUF4350 domain-containing protein [Bacillus sp. SD088]MBO0995088.1 DUF4350 domain-containing protein [Bacillus sp. SD088]
MQPQSSQKRIWIWMTALLIIFVVLSYLFYTPNQKEYPDFVSQSPSPTGVKAFYTYLDQEFDSVERFHYSSEQLPMADQNQLLIIIEPFIMPDSPEMEEYQAYMEAGNSILLMSETPDDFFELMTEPTNGNKIDEIDIVTDQNGSEHQAVITNPLRLVTEAADQILLHDKEGAIGLKRSYGHGQLYVVNSPKWLANEEILTADHIPIMISLLNDIAPDEVLFDEYLHGSQSPLTTAHAYPQWFILIMIQGTFLAILWLWYTGKRFGPTFILREESVRFSDERLRALSSWYLKGKLYQDSLLTQTEYVRTLMQERWGISTAKDWADISDDLAYRDINIPGTDLTTFISKLTYVLAKKDISNQEYLYWSKNIDRLRKEVEEG